jgi:membrane-associated protease RseP (regulator of RpoE activity)
MTSLRASMLALSIVSVLALAGTVQSQSKGPTPAQEKELAAAREDLNRAARRLAELSARHGGQGFAFNHELSARPVVGVLFAPDPGGGVRIAGITPDGAAAAAGIRSGDRLLRIDGKTIEGNTPDVRVENARKMLQGLDADTPVKLRYARGDSETDVGVTPKLDQRVMVFSGDGKMMRPGGNVVIRRIGDGGMQIDGEDLDIELPMTGAWQGAPGGVHAFAFSTDGAGADGQPIVDKRVIRIECKGDQKECRDKANAHMLMAPAGGDQHVQHIVLRSDCKPGENCKGQQRLAEAFRWNGLNLASVDPQLGRYFGTDKGVLVLSAGPVLEQLQPGDVIQRVDGKAVDTPRAVMDSLRDKPAESSVQVDYLRDRKSGSARIKVPKAMAFPSLPIAPPAPPAPPRPLKAGAAPQAPAGAAVDSIHRRIVMVDNNGQVQTWEDDGNGDLPMLPAPPVPPAPRVD